MFSLDISDSESIIYSSDSTIMAGCLAVFYYAKKKLHNRVRSLRNDSGLIYLNLKSGKLIKLIN